MINNENRQILKTRILDLKKDIELLNSSLDDLVLSIRNSLKIDNIAYEEDEIIELKNNNNAIIDQIVQEVVPSLDRNN